MIGPRLAFVAPSMGGHRHHSLRSCSRIRGGALLKGTRERVFLGTLAEVGTQKAEHWSSKIRSLVHLEALNAPAHLLLECPED